MALTKVAQDKSLLTLRQLAARKLDRLCDGLACAELREPAGHILSLMSRGWAELPALAAPHWPSDITDDGSPFEFSVAFAGKQLELRLLVEPMGTERTVAGNWRAGLELNRDLVAEHGVTTTRFDRIKDCFAPPAAPGVRFALWHSAALEASGRPTFKAYLNPEIGGPSQALPRLETAFRELGMKAEWQDLSGLVGPTGQFIYVSLDLVPDDAARFKVYAAYDAERVGELDAALSSKNWADRGQVAATVRMLTGERPALDGRPIQVCYSYHSPGSAPALTVYVPVRSHCDSDATALEYACRFLDPALRERLSSGVQSMAGRPLESGRGLITYVAFRPRAAKPSVTVYLSPEVYSIGAPRRSECESLPAPRESSIRALSPRSRSGISPFSVVLNAIDRHRLELSRHPFIQHLRSERGTIEDVRRVSSRVAFFVMAFQDVLRLVRKTTTDPLLERVAVTHEAEDKGHDRWYLHDLARLGVSLSVRDLFSSEVQEIRDISYAQISDVLKATDDCARLGIVMALEAAGAEFFGSMIPFVARQNNVPGLLYFARRHQQVEESHEMFTGDGQETLASIPVRMEALPEVLAVVARTFDTMIALADNLSEYMGLQVRHIEERAEGAA